MVSRAAVALALAVAAACGSAPSGPDAAPAPAAARRGKVVVISVDGLRPEAIAAAPAPAILRLAARGAVTYQARTIFPPITLPSHTSMLTGFPPAAHGLTWNDYRPGGGFSQVPTVFARAHEAGLRTVMVAGKDKLLHLDSPGTMDRFLLASSDAEAAAQAAGQARSFDLMAVHLAGTDTIGHGAGWLSPQYFAAVREADRAVETIVGALPPETTVILSADHGGLAFGHGFDRPEDMTIPWIAAGPRILSGVQVTAPVTTMDTAATVLYLLDLPPTTGATGRPVLEAVGS
jgi:predicted AlkP superfamily pyrophosphatase or phosphodiesterase